jgi:hypothetical protein
LVHVGIKYPSLKIFKLTGTLGAKYIKKLFQVKKKKKLGPFSRAKIDFSGLL